MAILKAKTHIESYKIKSLLEDFHELSGRNDVRITAFRNLKIINEILPSQEDVVIDIGCGDGTLLKEIYNNVTKGFGIIPSIEEKIRLEKEHTLQNIKFLEGLTVQLPCDDEIATKIICNGVLLLLDSKEELIQSIREIKRVSKKNAVIWIGEIPRVDEFEYYGKNYGDSILKWLFSVYKDNGIFSAIKATNKVIKGILTKENFIISPKKVYHIEPMEFVKICENMGFEVLNYFKSKTLDINVNEVDSPTRYDFILRKI